MTGTALSAVRRVMTRWMHGNMVDAVRQYKENWNHFKTQNTVQNHVRAAQKLLRSCTVHKVQLRLGRYQMSCRLAGVAACVSEMALEREKASLAEDMQRFHSLRKEWKGDTASLRLACKSMKDSWKQREEVKSCLSTLT